MNSEGIIEGINVSKACQSARITGMSDLSLLPFFRIAFDDHDEATGPATQVYRDTALGSGQGAAGVTPAPKTFL